MELLTKTIVGAGIVTTLGSSMLFGANEIRILDRTYTQSQYAELKTNITTRVSERAQTPISYSDVQTWMAIFNRENGLCRFRLRDVTERNLLDKLNSAVIARC